MRKRITVNMRFYQLHGRCVRHWIDVIGMVPCVTPGRIGTSDTRGGDDFVYTVVTMKL